MTLAAIAPAIQAYARFSQYAAQRHDVSRTMFLTTIEVTHFRRHH